MNITHLVRVRKAFLHDMAPRHIARHNMRAWVRSVRFLGPKWRGIAIPMEKQA